MSPASTPPSPARLGTRLRDARIAAGLNLEGLAYKAGVSMRTIERIEAGEVTPRRATLFVLAHALGVKPDELAEPAS